MPSITNIPGHIDHKGARLKNILVCTLCIIIPLVVGGLSGYITSDKTNGWWFNSVEKLAFQSLNNVFAPAWTSLYLLMGISLYLVWKSPKTDLRRTALWIFALQLFLNFWWSILFFSFHFLFLSIVDITIMWVLIFYMILLFRKMNPSAGYVNIPYLLWVSFATILNISLWIL